MTFVSDALRCAAHGSDPFSGGISERRGHGHRRKAVHGGSG